MEDSIKIVVVGGDKFEAINCNLCDKGFCIIKHINGRKKTHQLEEIPKSTDLILVFTDFVNHNLCYHIKKESKRLGIRTLYSKRSWSCLQSLLCS